MGPNGSSLIMFTHKVDSLSPLLGLCYKKRQFYIDVTMTYPNYQFRYCIKEGKWLANNTIKEI